MRHLAAALVLLVAAGALADETACPPKPDDPCFRQQRDACGLGVKDSRTSEDLADRLRECRGLEAGRQAARQCKKSHDDPCWMQEETVCQENIGANPPPWSTPELQAKRRDDAKKKLDACRKAPPPKKGSNLPPWRKP
jgi:hypothetical protein